MAPAVFRAATLALRALANVCPASPTCPQDDKCTYVSNGESFQINCATDFFSGDLSSTQAATLTECIDDCANTSGCVAVSYVGSACYLKSTLNPGQANDNVIGAYVTSSASAPSSAVASSSVPASSAAVVATSSTAVVATSSMAVVATSSTAVVATSSTAVVATSSTAVVATSSAAVIAASSSAPAPAGTACPASYSCPENNGCTIAGANSRTFVLSCGMDYYGGDYANMDEPSLDACNQACAQNTTCVAVVFTGGNGAGVCYLKDSNNGQYTNANVNGIYLDTNAAPASSSIPAVSSSTPIPSSTAAATPATSPVASSPVAASPSSNLVPSTSSAVVSSSTPTSSKIVLPSSSSISSTLITVTTAVTSTSKTTVTTSPSPSPLSSPATSSTVVVASTPKISATSASAVLPVSSSKIATSTTAKSTSAPAPTSVVNNPSFELGTSINADSWSFTGTALSSSKTGRVQGNAHTGVYSFQAQGQSLILPWSLNLVQTISVVPGKAYSVQLFSKQTILSGCALQVSYNNVPLMLGTSVPLSAYTASTALVSALMTTASGSSASLSITAVCTTGGSTSGLWIDDVTVTSL